MRGEREQRCINIVNSKIDLRDRKRYFGLNQEEIEEINIILKEAKPNEKSSEFPDFVLKNGLIEHFYVTSSDENENGSPQKREEETFKNKVQRESEKIKEEWNNDTEKLGMRSESWAMLYPKHDYKFLEKSIKCNLKKHIKSYEKYNGNKNLSVFMLEYSDLALEMYEDVYVDGIDGMCCGDLREPERVKYYRLSRDKKLLNYIYDFRDKIKYVIFVYGDDFEIIKLESIPYLIKLMPWNYRIAPYMGTILKSTLYCL